MSLLSVPFVGTGADTALHVVAAVVLIAVSYTHLTLPTTR